jgi:ubiquinone/menaquinone biosynthesis C-methylase UbiE
MTDFNQAAADWDADPAKHERARILAERIQKNIPLSPGMTALEYGCGTGLLSFALHARLGHITLADNSTGMLDALRSKIAASGAAHMTPVALDLDRDPVPAIRVDLIFTMLALHHVGEPGRILRAFYGMLNTPGYIAVADLDAEDGSFHGPDFKGHKGFDRDLLANQAVAAGFSNVRFETAVTLIRELEKGARPFPLFLMTAEKGAAQGRISHEAETRSN